MACPACARSRKARTARCSPARAPSGASMPSAATRTARRARAPSLQGLPQPNGLVMVGNSLFVFAVNRVLRYDNIEANLDNPPAPVDLTAAFALPTEQEHGGNHHWKFATLGPDGRIYTNVGVNCNVCNIDRDKFALLVSFNPDGSGRRIEARGVRNSRRHGASSGDARVLGDQPRPRLGRRRRAAGHAAARAPHRRGFRLPLSAWRHLGRPAVQCRAQLLGIRAAGGAAGRAYRRARHALLHRHDVPRAVPQHGLHRPARLVEPLAAVGLRRGRRASGRAGQCGAGRGIPDRLPQRRAQTFADRPVDVHVLRDGSMLVSGEQMGAIYRITYRR